MVRDAYPTQGLRRSVFVLSLLAAGSAGLSARGLAQEGAELPKGAEVQKENLGQGQPVAEEPASSGEGVGVDDRAAVDEEVAVDKAEQVPEIPVPVFSDSVGAGEIDSPIPRNPFVPGVDVSPGDAEQVQAAVRSGASEVGKNRFQSSSTREYLIQRARQESAARTALLKRYRDAGWNYGQPTIDSNIWYSINPKTNQPFSSNPFLRSRRFFVTPVAAE